MERLFLWFQLGSVVLLLVAVWRVFEKKGESGFQFREAERIKKKAHKSDSLAQAKLKKKDPHSILQLEGIRTDLPPHEILGVPADAPLAEIERAYRHLMKRYHPDRIGRPGSREWEDAQKIAEAINTARDHLIRERRRSNGHS